MKDNKPSFKQRLFQFKRRIHIPNVSLRLVATFLCLLAFAKLVETNVLFPRFDKRHAERIQKIFTEKEKNLQNNLDDVMHCVGKVSEDDSCFVHYHKTHEKLLKKNGLYIFVYKNDSLKYWSSKDVTVNSVYSQTDFKKSYATLGNGRYASFVHKQGNFDFVGLILIKNIYTYENKYLKAGFQKDFNLPDNLKIYHEQFPNGYPITDSKGQPVWWLIFDGTCHYPYQIYVPACFYFLSILVFFMLLDYIFQRFRKTTSKNISLPLLALLLVALCYAMQHWQIPSVFYELAIFNPIHFASRWFPSLGELSLWAISIGFFTFELYRNLRFPIFYESRWKYFAYITVSLAGVIAGFFGIEALLKTLIVDSSEMFEGVNRILMLNGFSLLGYLIIMIFLVSFCLLLSKTLHLCKQELTLYQFFIFYLIILSVVTIVWLSAGLSINFFSIVTLTVVVYIMGVIRLKNPVKIKYSHYVLIVFIFSTYTTYFVERFSSMKYESQKEVIVTNLASQHDLTTEFLLENISEKIVNDTTALVDLAYESLEINDNLHIINYIQKQFFYASYWNRYTFRGWVCADTAHITVDTQERKTGCIDFFKDMTENFGSKLPRSEFWYVNRGYSDFATRYLGWFRKEKEGEPPLHVFLEFWIIGDSEEVGYPELLLDNRTNKDNNLKGYSYAKYNRNKRISQYGSYKYNLTGDIFQTNNREYHMVRADGMEHLVYRPDKNNMIVLSSYSPKPVDLLINFSYIFIFSFLIVSFCLLLFYLPMIRRTFQWNFRNKIQYTMITIIVISFAIIGVGTVFYVNRQYQMKNNAAVNEKMQAIHSELLDVILFEKKMDPNWAVNSDLTGWLMQFQRIFFIDINLFDVNGQLIATSLPDIFDKSLVGRQMNPDAFIKLTFGNRAFIMEHENIGKSEYLSAYEPFVDEENKVIAFLNLPHFTQQDAFTEELSNVIMAITNFYMIIILLTVIISVMMSNQITQPLIMLQEKFRHIKLGEKNEPIQYDSHDEIGELVKEYNRAIEELARSANRLARSERESAWREMAKQIAHEINNPLTPMKLSIQHLKRAYDNKSERFNEYMEKISRSLVEQIDTLSSIATEFSNFAKMPAPQNQQIDLIAKINNVVPLFATGDNKRAFHVDFHGLEKSMIYADKEQISRVFINLFKNALQAIPKDRQAEIDIDVLKLNQMIWIRIKDNGAGIPEDMQEKIFRPNFTTKSSGMGLGLAIVRNIIESAGGTISFRTKQNEGTTFIISLPSIE